jgi:hypothetical protein
MMDAEILCGCGVPRIYPVVYAERRLARGVASGDSFTRCQQMKNVSMNGAVFFLRGYSHAVAVRGTC